MNAFVILVGIFSCILVMFSVTHSFKISGKDNAGDRQLLIERPLGPTRGKYLSVDQDDDSINNSDDNDERVLGKRRFNAWAGKRSLASKRRFNAWAGRR